MTTLPRGSDAALAPVRAALLAAAEREADELRRAAADQAQAVLDDARHEVDRIRSEAVAQGEAEARSAAALRSARVRRQAHETVLTRRNDLRLALQREVAQSARALRDDPRYPDLLARLTARCRSVLGPAAVVSESPEGGVVAVAGSRRLDLSLPVLAAGAITSMTPEMSALWTS